MNCFLEVRVNIFIWEIFHIFSCFYNCPKGTFLNSKLVTFNPKSGDFIKTLFCCCLKLWYVEYLTDFWIDQWVYGLMKTPALGYKSILWNFPSVQSNARSKKKKKKIILINSIFISIHLLIVFETSDGKKVRGRRYPWGVVDIENLEHCDFVPLR